MRNHFTAFHIGKVSELTFAGTGATEKKQESYKHAIIGYKKFLKKQLSEWFKPHKSSWASGLLIVSINPEIGLVMDGKKVLIKLYLKKDKLTKTRIDVALAMMRESYTKGYEVAILDVRQGRLHIASPGTSTLHALLVGEATTFLAIWDALSEPPA